jgi:DNA-binding response OmpR family regulator
MFGRAQLVLIKFLHFCHNMKHRTASQSKVPIGTPTQAPTNSRCRILLVDDDHDLRSFNAALLVQSGYHVDTAGDGASGWRALKAHHYDVLITDNTMPGVTGLELIKKLRSEDMTLPVIMASGTVPTEELIHNPWLHVDAMLPKPYTITELVKTVGKVLHRSGPARK